MLQFLEVIPIHHGDFVDDEGLTPPPLTCNRLPLGQLDTFGNDCISRSDTSKRMGSSASNLQGKKIMKITLLFLLKLIFYLEGCNSCTGRDKGGVWW